MSNLMVTFEADAQQWDSPCPQIRPFHISWIANHLFLALHLKSTASGLCKFTKQMVATEVYARNKAKHEVGYLKTGPVREMPLFAFHILKCDRRRYLIHSTSKIGDLVGWLWKENEAGKLLSYQRLLIVTGMSKQASASANCWWKS